VELGVVVVFGAEAEVALVVKEELQRRPVGDNNPLADVELAS